MKEQNHKLTCTCRKENRTSLPIGLRCSNDLIEDIAERIAECAFDDHADWIQDSIYHGHRGLYEMDREELEEEFHTWFCDGDYGDEHCRCKGGDEE